MLEFKFRAWHKKWNVMIGWELLSPIMMGESVRFNKPLKASEQFSIPSDTGKFYELRPGNPFVHPDLVMMQYSGFQDINGTDIYQGDVIKVTQYNPDRYAVDILDGGFCMTHPLISTMNIDINHFNRRENRIMAGIECNIYSNPRWV